MNKRSLSLAICAWLAASATAFSQSYIFQVAGQTGAPNQASGLVYNNFRAGFVTTSSALSGAFQVVSTPNGSQFYIVAPGGIQAANSAFSALTTINGLAGVVKSARVSADGRRLLVVTDQHLYVIDTASNTLAGIDPGVTSNGGSPIDVAISHDGKTAWVLASTGSGSTLTAVNLATLQSGGTLDMGTLTGTSVTLSPQGLLYVTFLAQLIYEINPATMSVTPSGQINSPGLPGPLHFTPDGSIAYAINLNVCGICSSILKLTVAGHSVAGGVPADTSVPPPQLTDVIVGGGGQVYALSGTKMWDVTSSPLTLTPSSTDPLLSSLPTNNVLSVAISNERPSPRYLYVLSQDNNRPLARIDLLGSGNGDGAAIGQNGVLWFDAIPAQTGAYTFFQLNPSQTVGAGLVSAPFIAQLIDVSGHPVFNQQVTFTTDAASAAAGLVINTPSQVTGAEGFAQTTITAPTAQGSYLVTAVSGGAIANFTVVVGAGTNPGSNPQMTIYSGDGQLLRQQSSTLVTQPLTVKITDAGGNPLAGIPVSFTVTQGVGSVIADGVTNGISGSDGLAAANFVTGSVDQSFAFQPTTVNASSVYGSVDFVEVTQNAGSQEPGQPSFQILSPDNLLLTIPQGGSLFNGIVAKTVDGHFPQAGVPIPNVGIRLAEPSDLSNSKVLSCSGTTRGDNTGTSRCNVVAACQPNVVLPRTFNVVIAVGEAKFSNLQVVITNGTPSIITPTAGNGSTGHPGEPAILQAKITDGCGQPVSGVTVVWSVTQGNGSVTPLQGTSAADGIVSARVVYGNTPGQIVVQASSGALASASFQLTTTVAVAGITLVSGGGQVATIGQPYANPVIFAVRDTNGGPVSGLLVNFTASLGASASPLSATTNAQGQVQTSVTAGATAGNVIITATTGNFSAIASLTANLPGPVISITSFTNAASGAVGMTPCGLVTVTGPGIAPTPGVFSGQGFFGQLPFSLAGLSITANNLPVPIHSVINDQFGQRANFQAPCELTPGAANVVVTVNGASATVSNVPVLAVQPGIFVSFVGNKVYGSVYRAVDNSLVTAANPARRGETLFLIATGLGLVTPATATNALGTGSQNVNLPIVVGVSDRGTAVLSARYLAGYIGAYRVDFQIPLDAPTGFDQSLALAALINNGTNFVFGNPLFIPGVI